MSDFGALYRPVSVVFQGATVAVVFQGATGVGGVPGSSHR